MINKCTNAAFYGNLDLLKKYHEEKGLPLDDNTCYVAVKNGNLECLKYCYENGCSLNQIILDVAIINGHFECMKYIIENKYPVDQESIILATEYGQLKCLIYLHHNGYGELSETLLEIAITNDHFSIVKYLIKHYCPFNEYNFYRLSLKYNTYKSFKFINNILNNEVNKQINNEIYDEKLPFILY